MKTVQARSAALDEAAIESQADRNGVETSSCVKTQIVSTRNGLGRRKLLKRFGAGVAAGVVAALPIANSALADNPTPSATAPGSSSLPPAGAKSNVVPTAQPQPTANPLTLTQTYAGYDFRPIGNGTTYTYAVFGGISWLGGGDRVFWHRLLLPQGSKVTGLTFYFIDNDASNDLSVGLFIIDPTNPNFFSQPANLASSGASVRVRNLSQFGTTTAPIVVIDNSSYSYQLLFTSNVGNANHTFYGAKISYTNVTGRFQAV